MATPERLQEIRDHVANVGISSDDLMDWLSDDAKAVAGCFGMMTPGKGEMVFHMIESRPSDRMQAGLDELVAAGVVKQEPFNQIGGVKYMPLMNMRDFFFWLGKNKDRVRFPMTQPLERKRA